MLGMVLDKVHDGVQAAVYGASVLGGRAEILALRAFLVPGNVQNVFYDFVDAFVLHCRDGDYGDSQLCLHTVDAYGASVVLDLVHHVEGKYHWYSQLHELHGEVQVALDVGCVDDVDNGGGLFLKDEAAADDFLVGIW